MKILIASDTYYPNAEGQSYFTQRLAEKLAKEGQDVLVVTPSRNYWDQEYNRNGVNIFGIRSIPFMGIRIPTPFIIHGKLLEVIQKFKPDIIHIQDHFAIERHVVYIAKILNIPIVGTNHFMPENLVHHLHLPPNLETKVIKLGWKHFANVFNRLNLITSPSQTAANLLHSIGIKQKIIPISNGISLDRFNPHNNGEYLKTKFNIPAVPVFLFVGRLSKEKNIDQALNSFAETTKNHNAHFIIAGTGVDKAALQNLVTELKIQDKVTFTGFIKDEDLPNLYAISTCFVMPGTAELQSIATMEAMATGKPIIAANALALPELVNPNQNGYLFTPGNLTELSKAMEAIITQPEKTKMMGIKSLEIVKHHDINLVIQKFINIYKQATL